MCGIFIWWVCCFVSLGVFVYYCVRGGGWGFLYLILCYLHVFDCFFKCIYLVVGAKALVLVVYT